MHTYLLCLVCVWMHKCECDNLTAAFYISKIYLAKIFFSHGRKVYICAIELSSSIPEEGKCYHFLFLILNLFLNIWLVSIVLGLCIISNL